MTRHGRGAAAHRPGPAARRAHRRARRLRRRRHHRDVPARRRPARARRRRALAPAQPLQRGLRRLGRGRGRARPPRASSCSITVDCGINARAEVARAQALGMDVIVTDHHELEGDAARLRRGHPQAGRRTRSRTSPASASPSSWRTRCCEEPGRRRSSSSRWRCGPTPTSSPSGTIADVVPLVDENRALADDRARPAAQRAAPGPGGAAGGRRRSSRAASTPAPSAFAWRRASTPPAASRTPRWRSSCSGCADREAALPLALRLNELNRERQAIEAAMLDGGRGDGARPAAGGARAVVARLARGRRRHRRLARGRALQPAGDPAQRGRRRGQGLRAQHPRLRPARRRRAQRPSTCSPSAGTAPPAACVCGATHIPAFREAFVAQAAATLSADDLVRRATSTPSSAATSSRWPSPTSSSCSRRTGSATARSRCCCTAPRSSRRGSPATSGTRSTACAATAPRARPSTSTSPTSASSPRPGATTSPLALSKNDYNGAVSAQVQVRGLHRLEPPGRTSAPPPATCAAATGSRRDLWAALLRRAAVRQRGRRGASRRRGERPAEAGRRGGRRPLVDRRGAVRRRSPHCWPRRAPLVLVADVAAPPARRALPGSSPTSSRARCSPRRARRLARGATAALRSAPRAWPAPTSSWPARLAPPSAFAAAFAHVVLLDPPFTRRLLGGLAAAAPDAWVHALWGPAKLDFAGAGRAAELDLDAAHAARLAGARRRLAAGLTRRSSRNFSGQEPFLRRPAAAGGGPARRSARPACSSSTAAAATISNGRRVRSTSPRRDTYRAWHTRFRQPDFLQTCLTARL